MVAIMNDYLTSENLSLFTVVFLWQICECPEDEVNSVQGEARRVVRASRRVRRSCSHLRGTQSSHMELGDLNPHIWSWNSNIYQVLRSRETSLQQSLAALEKERGVSGFRDTTENLERVAEQKAGLDERKGATLEEMSGLVHQLTLRIGERKARLAPIIKELRPLRQQSQDMQALY